MDMLMDETDGRETKDMAIYLIMAFPKSYIVLCVFMCSAGNTHGSGVF